MAIKVFLRYAARLSDKIYESWKIQIPIIRNNKVHKDHGAQLSQIIENSPPPLPNTGHFHIDNHQKWLCCQIQGGENQKERPNRSKSNGDMAETAQCYVVCE